jgi:hypothetical protein
MQRRAFLATPLSAFAAPPQVRLDPDGMLVRNGVRTFALGLYRLPQGPDAWKRAADAGFHFVHAALKPDQLDLARVNGMQTWATLGSLRKPEDEQRIRQLLAAWKDRAEILFWETEDEPSFVWNKPREFRIAPEIIHNTYKLVKSIDPARPLYLNHSPTNLVSTPTPAETRFMAYQAIVHGATGLLWWGLHRSPPESGVWDGIAATARELKSISAELAAPASKVQLRIEYHDTGHSLDRGIEWIVKPSTTGSLLIAVNADKNPVEATLRLGPWSRTKLFEPFSVSQWNINP